MSTATLGVFGLGRLWAVAQKMAAAPAADGPAIQYGLGLSTTLRPPRG